MFAATFVLYTIYASNGLDLMKYYVEAFHKVFNQLDKVATNPTFYTRIRAAV
jgi:hypothetical protein